MDNARAMTASFAQSDAFQDFVVNGIAPDGSFDLPFTGIVSMLREGLRQVGVDGWASLDAVLTWVAEHLREHSSEKCGCRTWPQVLNDSGQFDLQNRLDEAGKKVAWFRERATVPHDPAK